MGIYREVNARSIKVCQGINRDQCLEHFCTKGRISLHCLLPLMLLLMLHTHNMNGNKFILFLYDDTHNICILYESYMVICISATSHIKFCVSMLQVMHSTCVDEHTRGFIR